MMEEILEDNESENDYECFERFFIVQSLFEPTGLCQRIGLETF